MFIELFQFDSDNPKFKSLQGYDMIIALSQEIINQRIQQIFISSPNNFLTKISLDGIYEVTGFWNSKRFHIRYNFLPPFVNFSEKIALTTNFTCQKNFDESWSDFRPKITPIPPIVLSPQVLNLQVKLEQNQSTLGVYEDVEKTIEASPSADQQFLQWYSKTSPFPIVFPIILKTTTDDESPDFMPTNADYSFFYDSNYSNRSSFNYLVVADNKPLPSNKEGVPYRNWIDKDDIQGAFVLSANLIMNWFLKIFANTFNSSLNDFKQEIAGGSVTTIFDKENFGFDIEQYISLPEIKCIISVNNVIENKLCTASFKIPNDESIDFIFGFNTKIDDNEVYLTFTSREVAKYKPFQTAVEKLIHTFVSKPDINSVGKLILASKPEVISTLTTKNIVLPEGDEFFFKDARFVDGNLVVSVTYKN